VVNYTSNPNICLDIQTQAESPLRSLRLTSASSAVKEDVSFTKSELTINN
jgi:hypothetical protein